MSKQWRHPRTKLACGCAARRRSTVSSALRPDLTATHALDVDGTVRWRVPGLSGEDSPNVADLDGDGSMEIVGMTFGAEVYCLNAQGKFKWRRDLRPKLDDGQHMYMAPADAVWWDIWPWFRDESLALNLPNMGNNFQIQVNQHSKS